jgi:hypothetical protein
MLLVEEDAAVLLDRLATYELAVVPKWLDRDET